MPKCITLLMLSAFALPAQTFINSCQEITAPGWFILSANIVSSAENCINIHDTGGPVTLEGQDTYGVVVPPGPNTTWASIRVSNSPYATLRHLNMPRGANIWVDHGDRVFIMFSSLYGNVENSGSNYMVVQSNTKIRGHVGIYGSPTNRVYGIQVSDNYDWSIAGNPPNTLPAALSVNWTGYSAGQNYFGRNHITADSNVDDHMVFYNAAGWTAEFNTLDGPPDAAQSNYDCGIELIGENRYWLVQYNTINGSPKPIAGFWNFSTWSGTIRKNVVDGGVVSFNIANGTADAANTYYNITDWNISDNTFPGGMQLQFILFSDTFQHIPNLNIGRITIARNKLGTIPLYLSPGQYYTDGGGNYCDGNGESGAQSGTTPNWPIACLRG